MSAINSVLSSDLTLKTPADGSNSKDPKKIHDAAMQFESLMIGQVFKTIHEDDEGWLGSGEDASSSSAMGMADEYFAQAIAKRGGLGLAQMISRQLAPEPSSSTPSTPPSPAPADIANTAD